jgi:hypothetical protein
MNGVPDKFMQWHESEMAQMAAMLVSAAGGKITVTRQIIDGLHAVTMEQIQDHATGEMTFTTDPDIKAFDASFKEIRK